MPLSDDDLRKIADVVWFRLITDPVTGQQRGAQHHLASAYRFAYEATNRVSQPIDVDALADAILSRINLRQA